MVTALAFAAALVSALFFNGIHLIAFGCSLGAVVLGIAGNLIFAHRRGIRLPGTAIAVTLTLFWFWIGASIGWSEVPYASAINFWWVGALPLMFWLYTLAPDPERTWRWVGAAALAVGLAMALEGVWQALADHIQPRSLFLNPNSHAAFLNLILLPVAGRFLLATPGRRYGWGGAVLMLAFAVALVQGRGAALTLALGLAVLVWVARHRGVRGPATRLVLLVGGAFAAANLLVHGGVVGRLETLFNPASAGQDRFVIWTGAWRMFLHHPWFGTGLGTFWLAWPPYRNPADTSGGFYVHNDYLQIAIETGVVGAVLLITVLLATLARFRRTLAARPAPDQAIELASLFAALLAVAAHSFVTFNLYILPIGLVAGLLLGRFQALSTAVLPVRTITLRPSRRLGRAAYALIIGLATLLPLSYFAALGLSDHYYQRAKLEAQEGRLPEADADLLRALRAVPSADSVRLARADLLREVLQRGPQLPAADRRALFQEALRTLATAQRLNPLRAQSFYVQALLLEQNPALAGPGWQTRVNHCYAHALKLDPRFYQARSMAAEFLLSQGRRAAARHLLATGLPYWYYPEPKLLAYYDLTARVYAQAGDAQQAARVRRRLKDALKQMRAAARAAHHGSS